MRNVSDKSCKQNQNTYFTFISVINPLTPNDPYRSRTAPLTSKVAFYILIQQM